MSSKQSDKQWNDVNEFLSQVGQNLNILEEEVDVKVQKEYFDLLNVLSKHPRKFKASCKEYIEGIEKLFDDVTDEKTKKNMLAVLSTIDDISVYRSIESFSKQDTPLKKWAVIALQQSRMLIQSNLMDDPGVFVSTGLGGQGSMLRYFCVFLNRERSVLKDFQQKIIRNETEIAINPYKGLIESVDFQEGYTTMLLLLPIDINLKTVFENIIDESNQFGNFLHDNMIITNVKKLSAEEIDGIMNKKRD